MCGARWANLGSGVGEPALRVVSDVGDMGEGWGTGGIFSGSCFESTAMGRGIGRLWKDGFELSRELASLASGRYCSDGTL